MLEKFTLERHEMAELKLMFYEQAQAEKTLQNIIGRRVALKKEIEERVGIKDLGAYDIDESTREATYSALRAKQKAG